MRTPTTQRSACDGRLFRGRVSSHELQQIFGEKWLRQSRFYLEITGNLIPRGACAEEDDRDVYISPSPTKLAQEHLPVFDWQHQIDDHEIGKLDSALSQRGLNIACGDHLVAFLLKHHLKQVPHGRIVVENQNRCFGPHSCIVTRCVAFANMRHQPTSELLRSPRMRNSMIALVLAASSIVVGGCGASKPGAAPAFAPIDIYPLRSGNAWSYDVNTGDPSTTLAVTRVETVDGSVATVRTGEQTIQYEIRKDGIRVVSEGAWLFRLPYEDGASWPARGGRTGRLVSTQASIETPAGRFTDCLEFVETGGKLELEVRTVYCPSVGPVAVDSTMRSNVSDRLISVHARLRGYQVDGGASLTP